jgi:pimeloyl-ACP methyl ester carboxylesterase
MKPRFNYFKAPDIDDEKNRHIVFYCEWGDPKNTDIIVCVHGLSRNSRDFDFLAAALADKYRVICIDVVGRGKSEWLHDKSGYDYETYVADIIKLFDHLKIRKTDWVGTSMGGIIGMIIASRYPHIIGNLVLNDIGPMIPGDAIARILSYVGASYEFHNIIDAEKTLRDRMATFGIQKEEHWKHIVKYSIIKKLNGKYTFAYDPNIIPSPKLANRLRGLLAKIVPGRKTSGFPDVNLMDIWNKISCPILVLRGKLSDVLTSEVITLMHDSHKEDLRVVELENIGHAPMLMDEGQIGIVRNWLLEHK